MAHYKMSEEKHAKIFGSPSGEERVTGRSRLCKVCGGWHSPSAWPHNCRPSKIGPTQILASPQLAPAFHAFKTGELETAEVINSRNEKREYMKRNELVEYDEGVGDRNDWVEDHENRRQIVADIKRFRETDPENLPPDLKAQRMDEKGSLEEGTEINNDGVEFVD